MQWRCPCQLCGRSHFRGLGSRVGGAARWQQEKPLGRPHIIPLREVGKSWNVLDFWCAVCARSWLVIQRDLMWNGRGCLSFGAAAVSWLLGLGSIGKWKVHFKNALTLSSKRLWCSHIRIQCFGSSNAVRTGCHMKEAFSVLYFFLRLMESSTRWRSVVVRRLQKIGISGQSTTYT